MRVCSYRLPPPMADLSSADVRLALRRLLGVEGPDGLHAYQDHDGWRWVLRRGGEVIAEGWRPWPMADQAIADARRAAKTLARLA